ncbi:hypothetical protein MP213Fo_10010 [Pseudochrobactrum sp. MP213Fo]
MLRAARIAFSEIDKILLFNTALKHFNIKLNQLDRYDNAKTLKSRAIAAIQPEGYPL